MPSEVTVPTLGLGKSLGVLAEWYVPDGASVRPGDLVYRYESDFVAFDIEASSEGTLRHRAAAGSRPTQGTPAGVILAPGEVDHDAPPAAPWSLHPHWDDEVDAPAAGEAELPATFEAAALDATPEVDEGEDHASGSAWGDVKGTGNGGFHWPSLEDDGAGPAGEPPRASSLLLFRRSEQDGRAPSGGLWGSDEGDDTPDDAWSGPAAWPERQPAAVGPDEAMPDDRDDTTDWEIQPSTGEEDGTPPAFLAYDAAPVLEDAPSSISAGRGTSLPWADDEPGEYGDNASDAPADESHAVVTPAGEPVAAFAMPVASVRVYVDLRELRRLVPEFRDEWDAQGIAPCDADIAVRAVSHALLECSPLGADGLALVQPHPDGEWTALVLGASRGPLRDIVAQREAGTASDAATAASALYDFGAAGVAEAVPPLGPGQRVSFALGAPEDRVVAVDGGIFVIPSVTLTAAYNPEAMSPAEAAALAACVRDLLEAPYTMLAA